MAEVRGILQKSLSPTTWVQYAKAWNDFECFARTVLEIQATLPILPFQAIMFFASLHQRGLAASTIRSSGSAIAQDQGDAGSDGLFYRFLQGLDLSNDKGRRQNS